MSTKTQTSRLVNFDDLPSRIEQSPEGDNINVLQVEMPSDKADQSQKDNDHQQYQIMFRNDYRCVGYVTKGGKIIAYIFEDSSGHYHVIKVGGSLIR